MAGMLYYPFANAPLHVLYQAALYWDDLATVVAPGWEDRMTRPMREMHASGLYRPVGPGLGDQLTELAIIQDELEYALKHLPDDDLEPPGPEESLDEQENTLHAEKLDSTVTKELLRRGLVRETPGAPWRLIASPKILNIVVSIIANSIAARANAEAGCTGRAGLRPHTNLSAAHRLGTAPTTDHDVTACWNVDLTPLLPVPRGEVMFSDLFSFRERYKSERQRMMATIDDLLHELSRDQRHPQDAFNKVQREMTEAADDLHSAARASRITWTLRPLAVSVAISATASVPFLPTEAAIPVATLSTLSAVMVNLSTNPARRDFTASGNPENYRYLHRAQTELGLFAPELKLSEEY